MVLLKNLRLTKLNKFMEFQLRMIIDSYHLMLALVLGFFVGGIAGYLGSLMLTKRMALVGGALGHLALPGVSLALLYHFDVGLGAFLFLFFGIFFI